MAGTPAAGPDAARQFVAKKLTFGGDFDSANIAGAQVALDTDGVTEVYEVTVAPDCSGELLGGPAPTLLDCCLVHSTRLHRFGSEFESLFEPTQRQSGASCAQRHSQ